MTPSLSQRQIRVTLAYAALWAVCVADWTFAARGGGGWLDIVRAVIRWGVFGASLPLGVWWLVWARSFGRGFTIPLSATATAVYVAWWQLVVFASGFLGFDALRAQSAAAGTWLLFFIGLAWVIWLLEDCSQHYERERRGLDDTGRLAPVFLRGPAWRHGSGRLNWNPLDVAAWYYQLAPGDWFNPRRFRRILDELRGADDTVYGEERRKLNQSLAGFFGYCLAFYLAFLFMTQLGGCSEIYEMPAGGGGPNQQVVQQVKVKKVIKKKFIVNPFSALAIRIPPIDDVKVIEKEMTQHLYQVGQGSGGMGYGKGDGSGFFGGTGAGKVRFIRLEYTGGDWDQDFGVGADLNMLLKAGELLQLPPSKIATETESRTINELGRFLKGKSPPYVYMTGQRNISLSTNEVKILRDYLTDKHGMIFADNGGSAHWHNQFFAMMNQVLPSVRPVQIPLDDVIHKSPYPLPFLPYVAPHGGRDAWGWKIDGRWVVYYHPGDIGDAWSDGHSGVRPDVWDACYKLGANIIFYSHVEYAKWLEAQQQAGSK